MRRLRRCTSAGVTGSKLHRRVEPLLARGPGSRAAASSLGEEAATELIEARRARLPGGQPDSFLGDAARGSHANHGAEEGKKEPEPEKKLSRGDVDELIDDGTALVDEHVTGLRRWQNSRRPRRASRVLEEHMVMSRLCAKIGQCQLELRDVNGALRTFEKQLSSASEEKDIGIRKEGQASAHANLAHAQAMLGKDNEALEALEKSDGLLKDAPTQQARNASLAGVIHFRKGDIQRRWSATRRIWS